MGLGGAVERQRIIARQVLNRQVRCCRAGSWRHIRHLNLGSGCNRTRQCEHHTRAADRDCRRHYGGRAHKHGERVERRQRARSKWFIERECERRATCSDGVQRWWRDVGASSGIVGDSLVGKGNRIIAGDVLNRRVGGETVGRWRRVGDRHRFARLRSGSDGDLHIGTADDSAGDRIYGSIYPHHKCTGRCRGGRERLVVSEREHRASSADGCRTESWRRCVCSHRRIVRNRVISHRQRVASTRVLHRLIRRCRVWGWRGIRNGYRLPRLDDACQVEGKKVARGHRVHAGGRNLHTVYHHGQRTEWRICGAEGLAPVDAHL